METAKKLLEAQAPRAAGHRAQSKFQICTVDLEQREEELVQALSSKDPQLQGKAAWLNSSGSSVAANSPWGLCQRAIPCCPGAPGAAAGHWASEKPFGDVSHILGKMMLGL